MRLTKTQIFLQVLASTPLNCSPFIIEVVNCLHRLAEKCNICDNYYKRKWKLTWSWYWCDKTTEADKRQSQNIIAGTTRLIIIIIIIKLEGNKASPYLNRTEKLKQVEIIRQLTTPETNNGRHTQTLIPRVSFPVSSLFLIQTTSQTLGSRIQINKERNIAAPDKVWGNPTQKCLPRIIILQAEVCPSHRVWNILGVSSK